MFCLSHKSIILQQNDPPIEILHGIRLTIFNQSPLQWHAYSFCGEYAIYDWIIDETGALVDKVLFEQQNSYNFAGELIKAKTRNIIEYRNDIWSIVDVETNEVIFTNSAVAPPHMHSSYFTLIQQLCNYWQRTDYCYEKYGYIEIFPEIIDLIS